MEKTIRILAVLLGAQVLLALGLAFTGRELTAEAVDEPMLGVDMSSVERITIAGPDGEEVVLARGDEGWRLPALGDFPADGERVRQLVQRLEALRHGPPVATTKAALERFKVSASDFERRVTLAAGEKTLATLYVGTSPGMRQAHARTAEQDAVYVVDLATYEVPTRVDDWEDKTILQFPQEDIAAIEVAGLRLERATGDTGADAAAQDAEAAAASPATPSKGETQEAQAEAVAPAWTAGGLAEGETLDTAAAAKFARLLAELRIGSVLGQEEKPEYGLEAPVLEATLERKDGSKLTYRLGKAADDDEYTLKVSTRPEYFRLPSYTAEPLLEAAKRETLLGSEETADETAPAEAGQGDQASGADAGEGEANAGGAPIPPATEADAGGD